MSESCIFCKIIRGEIPCQKVFENEHVLVFKDIHPVAPVHCLAVPKKHIPTLNDATPADAPVLAAIPLALAKVAADLGVATDGYRVITNVNSAGGQEVFHLHFHLLAGRQMKRMG